MVDRPETPGPFVISSYTNVRVNGKADAQTSFSPILQWQVAWGTKPGEAQFTGDLNPDGSGFISGLTPGAVYYFWNRLRNEAGWSDLSARTNIRMKSRPDPPVVSEVPFSLKDQTSFTTTVTANPNWNGMSAITAYELAYGWIPLGPEFGESISHGPQGRFSVDDLTPGETYFLWARSSNIYGTSDWSNRVMVQLIAGARVKVGPVWKRAIPYVKDGGTWKMARPWVKSKGVWGETAD